LSVSPIKTGQYALIYQLGGIFPKVYMQIGSSPIGPFAKREEIWDSSHDLVGKNVYTYNAKAILPCLSPAS
jgi:hypothetical protein